MGNSTQFPRDINTSFEEPSDMSMTNWVRNNWHLCLFPAFVLGFSLNFGITIITVFACTIAYVLSFSLVVIAGQQLATWRRNFIIVVLPLLFLFVTVAFPFPTGAARHPYPSLYALIGRSAVSGAFGVLLWFGTIGMIRLSERLWQTIGRLRRDDERG